MPNKSSNHIKNMIINSATMRMILYYLNKKSGVSGLLYIVEIDKITMQSGMHQHFLQLLVVYTCSLSTNNSMRVIATNCCTGMMNTIKTFGKLFE
jgi:hypothetical protein